MNEEREMRKEACLAYFAELAEKLKDTHEIVASCNNDMSAYLVPKGTADQISYYGKPANSYRISDHWNWFANINRCDKERYVQCYCVDLPFAKRRVAEGKPSKPWWAMTVAYYGEDNCYHHVFGEKYDRKSRTWEWVDSPKEELDF